MPSVNEIIDHIQLYNTYKWIVSPRPLDFYALIHVKDMTISILISEQLNFIIQDKDSDFVCTVFRNSDKYISV